ncbi:uncharacterized protein AMSG_06274 [Thecamonas trahens ATCC 50062]|uniref:C3H1-type domain-containing protein n=1 Tax=Thecamonas trahens ATCC 50062 TaxID=461836 RepID=A0A0L0DD59_THETB|nr:hypothetical protein AMSG_06274 [Thecamonas trahens ATCC 50062]KNC50140.1 hypothetical protein AMSG_06274 [Thecamonas trahens ATCC 50062]|eukprot:XP_013756988.1 hypothetical protein AMSG_06274 [Thecamonas trahens ATCC 50062]
MSATGSGSGSGSARGRQRTYAEAASGSRARCKYWPACTRGDACAFVHPSEPCEHKTRDSCPDGQYCSKVHTGEAGYGTVSKPRCRYWPQCNRGAACPFPHPRSRCRNGTEDACPFGSQCRFLHDGEPGYDDDGSGQSASGAVNLDLVHELLAAFEARAAGDVAERPTAEVVAVVPTLRVAGDDGSVSDSDGGGSGWDEGEEARVMRVASFNVLWMNDLFSRVPESSSGEYTFLAHNVKRGIVDVHQFCCTLAAMIIKMGADVLCLLEGPDHVSKMELFVATYLCGRYRVFGGRDGYEQRIFWLVAVGEGAVVADVRLASDEATEKLSDKFYVDISGDIRLQEFRFVRIPLVVDVQLAEADAGRSAWIRLVGVHLKSKAVANELDLWNGSAEERQTMVRKAVINRRKMMAEAVRLRSYLDSVIDGAGVDGVVVAGDFNDGPGMDYFQSQYLTAPVADMIMGSSFYPSRQFLHGFLHLVPPGDAYTITHNDVIDDVAGRKLLLDHILLSPSVAPNAISGGIFHELFSFFGPRQEVRSRPSFEVAAEPRTLLNRVLSDHRPVWCDLDVAGLLTTSERRRGGQYVPLPARSIYIDTGNGLSTRLWVAPRSSSPSEASSERSARWVWRITHRGRGSNRARRRDRRANGRHARTSSSASSSEGSSGSGGHRRRSRKRGRRSRRQRSRQ